MLVRPNNQDPGESSRRLHGTKKAEQQLPK